MDNTRERSISIYEYEEEDVVQESNLVTKDHVIEGARKYTLVNKDFLLNKDEVKVLILYTGGTFGMMKTADGYMPKTNWLLRKLQSNHSFYDKEYSDKNFVEGTSVTPLTLLNQRIRYHFHEYDPLIDSSELNSRHYTMIAESIEREYNNYDSFIVIYGTDTMGYMASQLSFMLENLNKTVITEFC